MLTYHVRRDDIRRLFNLHKDVKCEMWNNQKLMFYLFIYLFIYFILKNIASIEMMAQVFWENHYFNYLMRNYISIILKQVWSIDHVITQKNPAKFAFFPNWFEVFYFSYGKAGFLFFLIYILCNLSLSFIIALVILSSRFNF